MATEWIEEPFPDVIDFQEGPGILAKDFRDTGVPLVRLSGLNRGVSVLAGCNYLAPETVAKRWAHFALEKGDILLSTSASLGRIAVVEDDGVGAIPYTGIIRMRPRDGRLIGPFIRYLLEGPDFQQQAEMAGAGSVIRHFGPTHLRHMTVRLPPLFEQRAIAHILGTLDDKIELNRRMSETLEAMARALFKSWFVDFDPVRAKMEGRWKRCQSLPGLPGHLYDLFPDRFVPSELGEIPEGWEVGALGQFFQIGLGGAWGKDEEDARTNTAVRCLRGIDCHDLAEGRVPEVPVRWITAKQAEDRALSNGTILIEGSGSFCGRSVIWQSAYEELIDGPVSYSNFCKRLDPFCSASQAIICWMQMRQAYREGLLQSFRTGTAFPNFDVHGALGSLIIVVPPEPIADEFARIFDLSRRIDLMSQSCTMASLRDTLLPKLISGDMRLNRIADMCQESDG